MKLIRVFPRKTHLTPNDDCVYIGEPDLFSCADKIDISVSFTYDIPEAERLYNLWKHIAPTEMGGPAFDVRGEEFIPGKYLKEGAVITSRGCNNKCWFCRVPIRDGKIRELKIKDGYNILDDNLLQCSDEHIKKVFFMLSNQKKRPTFTGGLEASVLKKWHCIEFAKLKPERLYFAYDTPSDKEPLYNAGKMLMDNGVIQRSLSAYCLVGYKNDTIEKAIERLIECGKSGFMPFAMVYRDEKGETKREWRQFQRVWSRPPAVIAQF